MSIVDHAVVLAEQGHKVFPIVPQGKKPKIEDFENNASVDILTISKWWNSWPNANIGIATGLVNNVFVVDLDGEDAIAWYASLGIPDGAIVATPRIGKEGRGFHHYYAIDGDIEIKTSRSEIYPNVDIRGEGGYVVAPGSVMAGKMYRGDLSNIPDAPPELLELLPRRQHFSHAPVPTDVEPVEAASEQERRELQWIADDLDNLERPWREGAGWRATVFQHSCWLWRMVRSPYYAIDESNAVTLILEHAPTDESWGDGNVLAEWEDAKRRTVGQHAQPPLETRPPLQLWTHFPTSHAFPAINGESFAFMWSGRPPKTDSGSLWARRQQLLIAALKSGMAEDEAATLIWHSAAAKAEGIAFGDQVFVDEDSRCITEKDLWREVDQAKEELDKDGGADAEPAPADERPDVSGKRDRPRLLTERERAVVNSPDGEWWGTRYLNWAQETFSTINLPYFRMNRWTVLSVIFAPKAVLPRPGANDRPLNIYQCIVGPTTSGKSEALRPPKHLFKLFYMLEESTPDIGGNFTSAALGKTLVERDGLSSWFRMDEAHTKIHEWKKVTGPFSDMPGLVTELYDGEVGAINRATEKELAGKGATTYLTVHLMGTVEGMAAEMGPEDWASGFLNRFVWCIGDEPTMDPASLAGDWINEEALKEEEKSGGNDGMLMYQQWASEFQQASQKVTRADRKPSRMQLPAQVIERHKQFATDLYELAKNSPYLDRLRPTFKRLNETALRCAALIALSEGRLRITLTDLLIAIEQTEEWAGNILTMVELTDETIRTREVNMIERFVLDEGGQATIASIHRIPRLRNRSKEVEGLIGELVAQGRAQRTAADKTTGASEMLKTKGVIHGN